MAVALNTPIEEVRKVTEVQITGFEMDYEQEVMISHYMTLLEDGTPYQRGQVSTSDKAEMAELFSQVQQAVLNGQDIDTASSEVAYNFVLSKI